MGRRREAEKSRLRFSCDISGGEEGRDDDIDEKLPLQNEFGSAELMGNTDDSEVKS